MTAFRRLSFVWLLVAKRLRRSPGSAALLACGIAAGAAVLATVLVGSLVARDRSGSRAIRALPGTDRALRVTWLGIPGQSGEAFRALDKRARAIFRRISDRDPFAVLVYRETRFKERLADLGAIDGLSRWVRLDTGRLPRTCTRERCEVVQLGGSGRVPRIPGLNLVLVGHGRLRSEVPFGSFISAGAYSRARAQAIGYHAPRSPPLLVTEGVEELARARALESIYRSYSWVVPLRGADVHPWTLEPLSRRVARADAALRSASPLYGLSTPLEQLQIAARSSEAGARRLLLIGGQAAALLLAFALLSGSSLRRSVSENRRRLRWLGASRLQLLLLPSGEVAGVVLLATMLGFVAGAGAGWALAARAGTPAGAVIRHSLFERGGLALIGVAALATGLLTLLALLASGQGSSRIGPLDVGAVGALAAIVVGFARGRAGPEELAGGGGTSVLLALLPGLAAFVAAVVCTRVLVPGLRLAERATRRAGAPVRLAVLSLARHPGRSSLAVAFLTVSIGLALFAATYRATLSGNEADEAAFAVGTDFVVEEDFSKLVYPLEAASLERYGALAPGVEASAVTRLPADVAGVGQAVAPTVLGLPAATLEKLPGWRDDFSSSPVAELASRIRPPEPLRLRGFRLPRGATSVAVEAATRGGAVVVYADIATEDGAFVELRLGETRSSPLRRIGLALPEEARGGLLVALRLGVTGPRNADAFENVVRGELRLGPLRAGGQIGGYEGWAGVNGLRRLPSGQGARLRYVVSNQVFSRFRPRQPTDGAPVPAIVSPTLAEVAGDEGLLPVDLAGQQLLIRVAGTADRIPTVDGDFVLADESWLATALNADSPGSGLVQEIWLRVPREERDRVAAALRRPPFADLSHRSRAGVENTLRREPVARGTLLTLAGASLAALVLAIAGLLLALVTDVRDERGELLDLETQGASPGALRRHLRLRAALVAAAGIGGGLVLGAVLTVVVTDLVALTASAVLPQPPLRLYVDGGVLLVGAAAFVLASVLVVALVTRSPFRGART